MARYRVSFEGWAGYHADVEVDDSELVEDGGEEEAKEIAIDKGYDLAPTLCAQCSGWGDWNPTSLEISDTWELSEFEPVIKLDD